MGFGGKGRLEPQEECDLKYQELLDPVNIFLCSKKLCLLFDLLQITSVPVKSLTQEAPGSPLCIPSSECISGKEVEES